MDRDETARTKPPGKGFADQAEVIAQDRPVLETPTGRSAERDPADRTGFDDEAHRDDVGAVPRSAVTGAHEPGTGANEQDGLDETSETVRRAAEDIGTGPGDEDRPADTPVFERGGLLPKG
ncbi:hypothetical protein [Rhodoplanes roseus]|uniref:Uncharacterized protein n=1 Tax=Rhodoplanes roseus TaxID=29409 RepID=A0A327KPT7_9BRAD|nr:hypothetical protein [Rhodoplanes roseus]RAI40401.1 hypothetical protein CH341_23810 [Rhodoplanes roseus]